jgi:hypothetical protein
MVKGDGRLSRLINNFTSNLPYCNSWCFLTMESSLVKSSPTTSKSTTSFVFRAVMWMTTSRTSMRQVSWTSYFTSS